MAIMKRVLVTGAAGFIGFHLVERLLKEGYEVMGVDNINDYYDVNLKYARLENQGILKAMIQEKRITSSSLYDSYKFLKADIADFDFIVPFMVQQKFDYVVNLAAQAGVRYSIENPKVYTHSNINGFLSILEGCRQSKVSHLVYASTSSVYGLNTTMPLQEDMPTEHPIALYAATKKANEMMAHSYSHLYQIPTTGLRFFTVYGPWGRPDMAYFQFADSILAGEPIKVFNYGDMQRDFTYVGDIVESLCRLLKKPALPNLLWDSQHPLISSSSAPYQLFNIGNSQPVRLKEFIECLEKAIGKQAIKEFLPIQPGDVPATHANTSRLEEYVGFIPRTSIHQGVTHFVEWYQRWKQLN
jgi:UDP-glucuronate 4-epimerase